MLIYMNKIILPMDIINKILITRPTHPVAELIKKEAVKWYFVYNNKPKKYFYQWFHDHYVSQKIIKNRKNNEDIKDYFFKSYPTNTNEQIVKLRYEMKQDNKRMTIKLNELNTKIYDVKTIFHGGNLNAQGNYTTVFYKNKEIYY